MTSNSTTEPLSTTETTHTSTKSTTTTTSSTPSPTAQIIIAYFTEGFSSEWAVYASDIGDTPDWCDGSHGVWKASDHISLDNVPYPDGHHKFDFKIDKMSKCSYSGSSDGAGKLSCPEFSSDVECSKYAHQKETICYAVADAMIVYPKVVCQWA
ncbi:uncharacterized protein N7459_002998 [Penicillium hispanicum]|uniref:uncharacterized protein n=1 Tax=Penicillium hispanicum TaxID=1080232 RepID=UPI002540896E|nr:uncharacterized protein N7459_002998 [Penicillium hispanicum]KAJ5587233.1 hypothetical protein N7459_002998 [Penicillium hispanicum]